jgi:hypothetical protein
MQEQAFCLEDEAGTVAASSIGVSIDAEHLSSDREYQLFWAQDAASGPEPREERRYRGGLLEEAQKGHPGQIHSAERTARTCLGEEPATS